MNTQDNQHAATHIPKDGRYKCFFCEEHLPRDAFNNDKSRDTGLASICRKCQKLYYKEYYDKNRAAIQANSREYARRKRAAEKLKKLQQLRAGRGWTPQELQDFITEMAIALPNLQDGELFQLLQTNGFLDATRLIVNAPVAQVLQDLRKSAGKNLKAAIKRASKASRGHKRSGTDPESTPSKADGDKTTWTSDEGNTLFENQRDVVSQGDGQAHNPQSGGNSLASLAALDKLRSVDQIAPLLGQAGELGQAREVVESLVSSRVSGLWERFYNEDQAVVRDLESHSEGVLYREIKERFLAELEEFESLAVPRGWQFKVDGEARGPNIMQLRTACMVRERRRIGNWSGTGTGKTLAAILSSRVVDARITLVITSNAVVEEWNENIKAAFPDSTVHAVLPESPSTNGSGHAYFVLNYEKFQGPDRNALVERLLRLPLDFIVLDEVQFVKKRGNVVSKRREAINRLVQQAAAKNPTLCVLGMSATPVINELGEARALLEIITGASLAQMDTSPTIQNGFAMNRALMRHGFRYKPSSAQERKFVYKVVAHNELLDGLIAARRSPLAVEQLLLPARLDAVRDQIARGTIIYSHYVQGMVGPIRDFVERLGLSMGVHTGEDKSGLEAFLRGEVDVLIGSSTLATGIDKLQKVSSRLILMSLPWTSALYDQIIGRVCRQGSVFNMVEVVVPQVILENNGDVWSWDQARMRYIENKRTLADCAVDGVAPTMERISRETLVAKGHEALERWKGRLDAGS